MIPTKSVVSNPNIAAAINAARTALEALNTADFTPTSVHDATIQTRELEQLLSMLGAAQNNSFDAIETGGVYRSFGHTSAKVMVRHEAKLSNAEALGREQARKMLAGMPKIRAAYETGEIGTSQIRVIARVWANKRVRQLLQRSEPHFLLRAQTLPYKQFHAYASQWEERADEDGTIDQTERDHQNRNFNLIENYDGTFTPTGGIGNAQGNRIRTALDHFVSLEHEKDFTEARINRQEDGPLVMPRTAPQRRADALEAMATAALSREPGGKEPRWVANNIIDIETLDRAIARLEGENIAADDPNRETYICQTIDGRRLHPTDIARDILDGVSPFRRAVIDARSVVIDLSDQRFATSPAGEIRRCAPRLALLNASADPADQTSWIGLPAASCEPQRATWLETSAARNGGPQHVGNTTGTKKPNTTTYGATDTATSKSATTTAPESNESMAIWPSSLANDLQGNSGSRYRTPRLRHGSFDS